MPSQSPSSSATGAGFPELLDAIDAAAAEYERDYLPEIKRRRAQMEARSQQREQRRRTITGTTNFRGGGNSFIRYTSSIGKHYTQHNEPGHACGDER